MEQAIVEPGDVINRRGVFWGDLNCLSFFFLFLTTRDDTNTNRLNERCTLQTQSPQSALLARAFEVRRVYGYRVTWVFQNMGHMSA